MSRLLGDLDGATMDGHGELTRSRQGAPHADEAVPLANAIWRAAHLPGGVFSVVEGAEQARLSGDGDREFAGEGVCVREHQVIVSVKDGHDVWAQGVEPFV